MKFTIERAPFIKALNHTQSIVDKRNIIPILSNVKLVASHNLTITATDLDIYAIETVNDVAVKEPGAITVSSSLLYDIARKLPEGAQIGIELKDGKLIVKAGRSRFTLPTIPADDFPAFPHSEFPAELTLTADELKLAIDQTRFAISTEETRYYLNGIFAHNTPDGITLAATDGHRLARHVLEVKDEIPDVIIPRKAINEIYKLLDSDDVDMEIADKFVRFTIGNVVLITKTIDGKFPDYARVIPKDNDKTLKIDARQLKFAIDRVTTVSTEKTRAVKIILSDDLLVVSVASHDNGSGSEEVPCSWSHGDFEIGFNAVYLRDVLGLFDGDVTMTFKTSSDPMLVDGNFVVMPMRV